MPALTAGRARVSRAASSVLRSEPFLPGMTTNIVSNDLTLGVNRPAKSGSNPLGFSAVASSDPNAAIGNNTAVQTNSTTQFFHNSGDTAFTGVCVTYCESTDGTTLTTPSLGLVNWGGSTANNVIHPDDVGDVSAGGASQRTLAGNVFYDSVGKQWVMVARPSASWASLLYTSSNATGPWTLAKTIVAAHATSPARDAQHVIRRSDGRWIVYYQRTETGLSGYYQGYRRSLGMFLSDTTDLTGAWTDLGAVLTASTAARQYYGTGAWIDGETLYVAVYIFDGTDAVPTTTSGSYPNTNNAIHKVALYAGSASDGSSLTLVDDDWLSRTGVYGEWDGGEIVGGHNIVRVGNEWRYYFGGDGNTHHQSPESIRYVGLSTIGYRRIGEAAGSGSVILSTVSAPAGGRVIVNGTDISNVRLLDGSNTTLAGYGSSDAIPSDAYDHVVSWGGVSGVPASFRVEVETLSGLGAVNHVEVRS